MKKLNPFIDSDKDGVINSFDCAPLDKSKQEIYNIRKMPKKLKQKIFRNNLYHKTEFTNLKNIIKTKRLRKFKTHPVSLSTESNVDVMYKKFKQPIVLVFNKKKILNKRPLSYDREGTFKREKEWVAEDVPIDKALKGVILNEKFRKQKGILTTEDKGYPTRYITGKDILKIKFKKN